MTAARQKCSAPLPHHRPATDLLLCAVATRLTSVGRGMRGKEIAEAATSQRAVALFVPRHSTRCAGVIQLTRPTVLVRTIPSWSRLYAPTMEHTRVQMICRHHEHESDADHRGRLTGELGAGDHRSLQLVLSVPSGKCSFGIVDLRQVRARLLRLLRGDVCVMRWRRVALLVVHTAAVAGLLGTALLVTP